MLKPNKTGFSLIELVITIAILSIGITYVLKALTSSINATSIVIDMTKALFLAKDKFQELEFKETQNLLANEPLEAKDDFGKYTFKYKLELSNDSEYYLLTLGINWETVRRKETLITHTFLRK